MDLFHTNKVKKQKIKLSALYCIHQIFEKPNFINLKVPPSRFHKINNLESD
jgi:hypothetical protein